MRDAVDEWQAQVVQLKTKAVHVYHVGHLAFDISSSPTTTKIQMMANGLHLMGRVGLRQRRVTTGEGAFKRTVTEYSFVVLQPISLVDFDTARKTYLESLAH